MSKFVSVENNEVLVNLDHVVVINMALEEIVDSNGFKHEMTKSEMDEILLKL